MTAMGSVTGGNAGLCDLPIWVENGLSAFSLKPEKADINRRTLTAWPSGFHGPMEKVLCVCLGNISRGPMMQVVLQQHLGADFLVESAGATLRAGYRLQPTHAHVVNLVARNRHPSLIR